jgi:hypothetical protein
MIELPRAALKAGWDVTGRRSPATTRQAAATKCRHDFATVDGTLGGRWRSRIGEDCSTFDL